MRGYLPVSQYEVNRLRRSLCAVDAAQMSKWECQSSCFDTSVHGVIILTGVSTPASVLAASPPKDRNLAKMASRDRTHWHERERFVLA